MQEWHITPEQAENAKVIAAGGMGTLTLIYLRHPGSLLRAAFLFAIGLGTAVLLARAASDITGIPTIPAAYGVGLLGKTAAEGLLKAIEKLDFSALMPWRKS